MREKIDAPEAQERYSRRAGIVEPVFADIRYCKGMDRFHYRGNQKVDARWNLYCLVHNLEKIAKYGKNYGENAGKGPLAPLFSFCQALIGGLRIILRSFLRDPALPHLNRPATNPSLASRDA